MSVCTYTRGRGISPFRLTYPGHSLCHSHLLQATAPFRMSSHSAIQPTNPSPLITSPLLLVPYLLTGRLSTTQPPPSTIHHSPLTTILYPVIGNHRAFLFCRGAQSKHTESTLSTFVPEERKRTKKNQLLQPCLLVPLSLVPCPLVPMFPCSFIDVPCPSVFSLLFDVLPFPPSIHHPHIHSKFTL